MVQRWNVLETSDGNVELAADGAYVRYEDYATAYRAGLEAAAKACEALPGSDPDDWGNGVEEGQRRAAEMIRAILERDSKPPR